MMKDKIEWEEFSSSNILLRYKGLDNKALIFDYLFYSKYLINYKNQL